MLCRFVHVCFRICQSHPHDYRVSSLTRMDIFYINIYNAINPVSSCGVCATVRSRMHVNVFWIACYPARKVFYVRLLYMRPYVVLVLHSMRLRLLWCLMSACMAWRFVRLNVNDCVRKRFAPDVCHANCECVCLRICVCVCVHRIIPEMNEHCKHHQNRTNSICTCSMTARRWPKRTSVADSPSDSLSISVASLSFRPRRCGRHWRHPQRWTIPAMPTTLTGRCHRRRCCFRFRGCRSCRPQCGMRCSCWLCRRRVSFVWCRPHSRRVWGLCQGLVTVGTIETSCCLLFLYTREG